MDSDSSLSLLSSPCDLSCSPTSTLSRLSNTPSLPGSPVASTNPTTLDPARRYPSPMSTTASGGQSPLKLGDPIVHDNVHVRPLSATDDGPRPAKRRRLAPPPKERTTERLDLTKAMDDMTDDDRQQMDRLVSVLRKKKKIVVIAGAGISVSAGIPDFRSANGLFATTRTQHNVKASGKHLFDASVYKHAASTQSFHTMVREMAEMSNKAKPTPFHHLLASLANEGRLMRLYSQNIDCIDIKMEPLNTRVPLMPSDNNNQKSNLKSAWPVTIQLHGSLEKMVCTKCSDLQDFQAELFEGPEAPLCGACKDLDQVRTAHAGKRSHGIGRLRPRFVLYNEYNPDEEAIGKVSSADLKARPDAVIVVGTSLKVPGTRRLVKELCQVTRGRKDGFTAFINVDSEPKGAYLKDCWDLVVRARCDDVAALAALPPWDCHIGDDWDASMRMETPTSHLEVHLGDKPATVKDVQAMPTPAASPKMSAAAHPAKTKQAKLAFKQTSKDNSKSGKVTKPRGRKPKTAVKNEAPKGNLLQSFKAVKSTSNNAPIKKSGLGSSRPSLATNLESSTRISLPPLRPSRCRSSSSEDTSNYQHVSSDGGSSRTDTTAPSTPTVMSPKALKETISPKSVPKDMRQVIDSV
ncbi:hypothetical protein S40285_00567 [Stachybotrys chlorohalonatus IBT 40285]|uniref:Deacetylase sirtuin-type domain-containing protein n=1 Tax=Stachybotrys chlorohalonatus (strain IBT 40285) TaxID=1283841 RepID=A0A084R2Q9_STAC4|nr:hypothetical protein S40285_00567 [Stachybotrys chlorohalonata IBT 40285]